MNQNTEYEKFVQEIYQGLINADGVKTIEVKHNVKLMGKSGQQHQIDVFWEYELAGIRKKVIIECKNYKNEIPIGKVRDFFGVLLDLANVAGIMATKVGYQAGAKKYADYYGINLQELRTPNEQEGILGEVELGINISIKRRVFLLDEVWAENNSKFLKEYQTFLDFFTLDKNSLKNGEDLYYPLEVVQNAEIKNANGETIIILNELENIDSFKFDEAYIDTGNWGRVKIKEVKYHHIKKTETKSFIIDARNLIKAILKDAINGKIQVIGNNGSIISKNP